MNQSRIESMKDFGAGLTVIVFVAIVAFLFYGVAVLIVSFWKMVVTNLPDWVGALLLLGVVGVAFTYVMATVARSLAFVGKHVRSGFREGIKEYREDRSGL